ncbi:MAG: hypothetical protein WA705_15090 [Candidatus Ozemobacteraceae bacterium]
MITLRTPRLVVSVAVAALLAFNSGSPLFAQNDLGGREGVPGKSAAMETFRTTQQEKTRAFLEKEALEGKTFMDSLNGKSKTEKLAAIKEFKTAQYEKNTAFREEMHKERLTFIETLGANAGNTQVQNQGQGQGLGQGQRQGLGQGQRQGLGQGQRQGLGQGQRQGLGQGQRQGLGQGQRQGLGQGQRQGLGQGQESSGPGMSAGMKEQRLARINAEYEEMKSFFAGKHAENLAFLDKMAADQTMDGPALNQAIQAFFQSQKADAQQYMQRKKAERPGGQGKTF